MRLLYIYIFGNSFIVCIFNVGSNKMFNIRVFCVQYPHRKVWLHLGPISWTALRKLEHLFLSNRCYFSIQKHIPSSFLKAIQTRIYKTLISRRALNVKLDCEHALLWFEWILGSIVVVYLISTPRGRGKIQKFKH